MMGKKNIITDEQRQKVKILFDEYLGARVIAKQLGITRWAVQQIYKELGIYNIGRKTPIRIKFRTNYVCRMCNVQKDISEFRRRVKKNTQYIKHEPYCYDCERIRNNNAGKIRAKILRQNSPNFIIKTSISYFIWNCLKQHNSSKNGHSCLSYLDYSISQLRNHLEKQFESWMSWDNHGIYNKKTWKDNDPSTWTWQIDHVIPQSDLPYTSMVDDNFKKCWSLDNLRPLSSKQNNFDGANRIRHKHVL